MATFPNYLPSKGSAPKTKARLIKVQLGDGYTQRLPDGINHLEKSWSLKWSKLTEDEAVEIISFLEDHGGYKSFTWDNEQWICDKWSAKPDTINNFDVSATFTKVFDL